MIFVFNLIFHHCNYDSSDKTALLLVPVNRQEIGTIGLNCVVFYQDATELVY